MPKTSAGLLMYRINNDKLEVLLAHPGGPYWKGKDLGAWTIPKGEQDEGEELFETAEREFEEETSIPSEGPFIPLGNVLHRTKKIIHAWAFEGDWDGFMRKQRMIKINYPYKSNNIIEIPEIDQLKFFSAEEAKLKLDEAQAEFVTRLERELKQL